MFSSFGRPSGVIFNKSFQDLYSLGLTKSKSGTDHMDRTLATKAFVQLMISHSTVTKHYKNNCPSLNFNGHSSFKFTQKRHKLHDHRSTATADLNW